MAIHKSDRKQFIVTEEFCDEDFDRPDVPDWFRNKIIAVENDNDRKKVTTKPDLITTTQNGCNNKPPYKTIIVWRNVIAMIVLHLAALYGIYLAIWNARSKTIAWSCLMAVVGGLGVLAGSHRLWTHRSYKARWPLRLLLMIAQTIALQNDIYEWCRDHRVHHKYSDTDADPHNSRRGFFFAHMGWLLCRKHPDVIAKGSTIDMSDVWADPIVRFQRRFYIPLVLLLWGIFPVWIPVHYWNENLEVAIMANALRYVMLLHQAWSVNSAAHLFGYRFYEQSIEPRENRWVVYLSLGEGYHNYHHTFPWDYSASEHGWRDNFNVTTAFIDLAAWLGLAYDRRIVSRTVIEKRICRTGDNHHRSTTWMLDKNQRKPVSFVFDLIAGILISTALIFLILILRYILR